MAVLEPSSQTQFSAEQPFFEQPVGLPQEEKVVAEKVPFFKRRKTILLIIFVLTVATLFILFVVNLIIERNKRLGETPSISIASPTPAPDSLLLQEVIQLRQELKAADPTQLELQPPAVDSSIRLDELRR